MTRCCKNQKQTATPSGVVVCGNCRSYLGRCQPDQVWAGVAERYARRRTLGVQEYRSGVEYREKMAVAGHKGWLASPAGQARQGGGTLISEVE